MNEGELFGRQVVLQFGTAGSTGKSFSDLRVSFDVKMSRSATPNTATIQIYNLTTESIEALQSKDAVVRLLAGYDVPKLIFMGEPIKNGVRMEQQGPDRILTIEAQDGGKKYRETRVDVCFKTQTSMTQVLAAVTEQLGVPRGTIKVDESIRFPHGISFAGSARDVLDRIAQMSDADWFLTDGNLQIVPKKGDIGTTAALFSSKEGNLIGSPTPTDTGIEVKALLDPSIRPGGLFRVESKRFNGDYIASDVNFAGDAGWDTTYYVTVRGKPA